MTGTTARLVRVRGMVQGVGFRWHCAQRAEALSIAGWVRNLPDGSVEAHVEGSPDAVSAMVEWLHEGPRWAQVSQADVLTVSPQGYGSFGIR